MPFQGVFDGGGFGITGLTVRSYSDYIGLFSCTDGADIKNLKIIDAFIEAHSYAGILCGVSNGGAIENCLVNGTVTAENDAGGITGHSYCTDFYGCGAQITINGNTILGGLTGFAYGAATISNCYSDGIINCIAYSGGFSSSAEGITFINCYSTCFMNGRYDLYPLVEFYTPVTMVNCHYDNEFIHLGPDYGEGKALQELMQKNTFTGWDFDNIWNINEGISTPFLRKLISTPSEPEPDDHPITSGEAALQNLDPAIINRFSGVIDYREDKDWFKISSLIASKYSLLMAAPDANVKIAVYDSNLNLLSSDRKCILNLSASGTFYIEISYNGTGRFKKSSYNIHVGKVTQNTGEIIKIDAIQGKAYNVSLNAKDSTDIGSKTFTVTYDANKLQLINAAGQSPTPQISTGKIPGTDITVLSHANGVLKLEVNRAAIEAYTGIVTILQFKGIANGAAQVNLG
jgi:hypothetical protein